MAPARAWNLDELHTSDGRPRRRGRVQGDLAYFLTQGLGRTNFGGPEFRARQAQEKRIQDPLGKCLQNVLALARCGRDERVAGLQAAAFAWLGVECTYVLSRERCVIALGELALALRLEESPPAPEGDAATAEEVAAALEELVSTLREVVAAPGLAGDSLERVCERLRGLPLDRAGALRLLRATNALLAEGERGAVLAPLRELRLELARRSSALALRAALEDAHGRVRAAALEASLRAFPAERAERLRWAMTEPMETVESRELVSLRALELIASYGLPPPSEGEDPERFQRSWHERLLQVLVAQVDGPHTIAACRALERITGEPGTLLPEVWLARWRAADAGRLEAEDEHAPEEGAPSP